MHAVGLTEERALVAFEVHAVNSFSADRVIVFAIQIDVCGDQEHFFVRIVGKFFQHGFVESMLVFLVLPTGVLTAEIKSIL